MPSNRNDFGSKTSSSDEKRWVDMVIDYRGYLACLVILATLSLAFFIPRLQTADSVKLVVVSSGQAYQDYERFVESFGYDDFLVVAVRNQKEATNQSVLKALAKITEQLEKIDKVARIVSLSNLKFFQKKGELLGMYPVLQTRDGFTSFPGSGELQKLRTVLPLVDLLLSEDLKTVGVIVQVHEQAKHDPDTIEHVLQSVNTVVTTNLLPGSE
jgi:predicted RND superfamily exporter protein